MNQFRKRADGAIVTEDGFRQTFPDIGFPAVLDIATLSEFGYDPILQSPQPEPGYGQYVIQDGVTQDVAGNWIYAWKVVDLDANVVTTMKAQDQQRVWEQIKAERDMRKAGGLKLTVNGAEYWFWTDDPSRNQYAMLDSMIRRNNLPANFVLDQWKTMSGAFVPFPVSLLCQVIDTGIANESALFRIAEQHRQAMFAADNPLMYDWHTGWPQTYAERDQQLQQEAAQAAPVE